MLVRPLVRSIVGSIARGVDQRARGKMPLVLGPELLVNGDFEAGQGPWIVVGADATHIATFSGGVLRYQSGTTSPSLTIAQSVMTAGKTYQVTVVCSSYVSGSIKSDAFSNGTQLFVTAAGSRTFRGTALSTSFNFTRNSANVDASMDSISVREVISG